MKIIKISNFFIKIESSQISSKDRLAWKDSNLTHLFSVQNFRFYNISPLLLVINKISSNKDCFPFEIYYSKGSINFLSVA